MAPGTPYTGFLPPGAGIAPREGVLFARGRVIVDDEYWLMRIVGNDVSLLSVVVALSAGGARNHWKIPGAT